jgi:hypothetical protein
MGQDETDNMPPKNERLKAAIQRLRNSLKISFHKDEYERTVARLRERNNEFQLLRSQIERFQQKRVEDTKKSLARKSLPSHYSLIQRASQTLHQALSVAWNCQHSEHVTHCAKLCIEAQAQSMVKLDMALSYELQCENGVRVPG